MFKKILIIALAITVSLAFEPGHEKESYIFSRFQDFLAKENKKYTTVEEFFARFSIFKDNYLRMEAMTVDPDSEAITYTVGINKFFDMSPQEFERTYLNLQVSVLQYIEAQSESLTFLNSSAPSSFDWRDQGAVGPVKDQGQCGSCWAFSTVANLEGLNFIHNKQLVQFSEQQLVDCDKVDQGCNGGLMQNAFNYIQKAGGSMLQSDYTYKGARGTCRFDKSKVALQITGNQLAGSKDEEQIKEFLYTTGPLSIAINASPLQFYQGGILDLSAAKCNPKALNHGVAIVGYGTENGQDYWIIKNSWGPSWGEKGYFRFARGKGVCGVNSYVISAKLS